MADGAGATRDLPLGVRDAAEARLRALTGIGAAATSLPAAERRRRVVEAAMAATGSASASLNVWRDDARLLQTVLNVGELGSWELAEPENETYPADRSNWIAEMPPGHLGLLGSIGDPETSTEDQQFLVSLGKHSFMSVPVLRAGTWWGEVYFTRRGDQPDFVHADLEWALAVAAQVGAGLETVEHLARADAIAHRDPLTGLANRRSIDGWLEDAVARLPSPGATVSLVVADVNGLKAINDEHGHDAGDRALVAFANTVKQTSLRIPGAVTARLGGDEFCIAARDCDADLVVAVAEELCRRGGRDLAAGVSVGVVNTADPVGPVESAGRLLRLADAAQYRAKRSGSRHPVVAGRDLPDDALLPLSEFDDHPAGDRRLLRGGAADEVHLLEAGMRALDQAPTGSVRVRLGLVADLVSHQLDAAGWWLSYAPAAADTVSTVELAVFRAIPGLEPADVATEVGETFPLGDFPMTRSMLAGGAYQLSADDPAADPAEQAILAGLGASGLVAAGGPDADGGRWLVEVFTDALSRPVRSLPTVLRLLVLAALHPPGSDD